MNRKQTGQKSYLYGVVSTILLSFLLLLTFYSWAKMRAETPAPDWAKARQREKVQVYTPKFDPKTGDFNASGSQAHLGSFMLGKTTADDLFQHNPTRRIFRGKLVYAIDLFQVPPTSSIVVRDITDVPGSPLNTLKSYLLEGSGLNMAWDPVLSPSKRFVAFKVGLSGQPPYYHLYVLDLQTDILKLASPVFNYDTVLWSPDEKYISYMEDQAIGETGATSLSLISCEWRTGKIRSIIRSNDIDSGFAWIPPHTILYGRRPFADAQHKKLANQPALYETDAETGSSRLTIKDAYRPSVSPDGLRVAFFGSENPEKPSTLPSDWPAEPGRSALCVAHRDGSKRVALNTYTNQFPFVEWLHDGHNLLTIERVESSQGIKAIVKQRNVDTGRRRDIGFFQAQKIPNIDPLLPMFMPGSVPDSDDFLFVDVLDASDVHNPTGQNGDFTYKQRGTLQAMDLKTGRVETVFTRFSGDYPHYFQSGTLRAVSNFDWREISSGTLKAAAEVATPLTKTP